MKSFSASSVLLVGILAIKSLIAASAHAEIKRFDVHSRYLSGPERVVVASPDGVPPAKGWPTLYLLNGYDDNEEAWPKRNPLDSLSNAYSVIIVCPDGRNSFYWDIDDSIQAGLKMESFITRDLVSYIDKQFHTDTASRSIAGYSMGGHGALYLTARHPRLFHCAVSLSGALDIFRLKASSWIKIPSRLDAESHSVFAHIDSLAHYSPRIMVTCGDRDAFLPDNKKFHSGLQRRKVKHVYKVLPGDHNWKFWREQLPILLDFVTTSK